MYVSFLFSIFYLYQFNFSFDAQNLPFIHDCSHIIILCLLLTAGMETQGAT